MSDRVKWIYGSDAIKARVGWVASVNAAPIASAHRPAIGITGPGFWRPTKPWALHRAQRYVRFRSALEGQ